ncbi:pentatricopeptide repeat-containing protein At4g17616 [Cynara cardunculus var. scolymus]|uniref:Pentatricopeptide repeat-containing protein n=1 Tax=Cynara cardunculus var. scolymus TaxID=59895 RepID=A0A103XBQ0_CYNCS|nr:pentatricopeptide repeat-containing protein At4g17616 [Cynara cardunculus var. scolymus]XP_024962877.1 pentatricopeptide repeat-containing protein At4g17616 [Cynara cardunculus var. scolymus]XP_024962879.1 pentatricopeptide repeat-containing protein At4g17616 [Cynara cardunculus var. scolymus]XP_024962880.1 pentatricopeptide repeat-containing protein At4g17616 [Cynara cardunculus var. scolymus]XP_024962881.1 pentatricopeptide repeat-containing protein At4g17616 [Cynara cardunculus var. scoly
MAWSLVRASMFDLCFIRSSSSLVHLAPIYMHPALMPICGKEFDSHNGSRAFLSYVFCKGPLNVHLRYLCSRAKPRWLRCEESSHDILLKELESCLKNHQVDEAWEAYTDFKRLYGLPDDRLLRRFITELSYSSEAKYLQRACDIILLLSKKKSNLLHLDLLRNLSLCLARAQMSIPASMILRIMIEKGNIPPSNLLGTFVLHMVKKEIGTYLASNILIQICDQFQCLGSNRSMHADLMKPDTIIFNLVLDACASYNLSFKAQQIIECMSQIGVVADAHTIIAIARIYEINGQRDELKKFKHCVDQVVVYWAHHYFQFYDSLMSLHFKFNDIDSASRLILDIINFRGTLPHLAERKGLHKPFLIPLGSRNLRQGLKLQVLPHLLHENSLVKLERNDGLVIHNSGKLVLSNKVLAKLVIRYKRQNRIDELSKLLCRIQTEQGSVETNNLCSDVIDACIHVGWLETAHDIIDDIEQEGNLACTGSYESLLTAYYEDKKHREAAALLKQIRKAGIIISDRMSILNVSIKRSDLITFLVQEMREGDVDCSIYELNSSIYFFMKAKMIDDALKTYQSMQGMKVHPTVATYIYMVMGYSSLEMYREITFLWGDIKRCSNDGSLLINRDLYEFLILNFLKGGYFERVMEVIGCMKAHCMYLDKWLYRSEFLKLHKDLYKKLKPSNVRTEAQCKRLAHVKDFRKWAGID